jgi:thiol:disulfide interchange protein DsbA
VIAGTLAACSDRSNNAQTPPPQASQSSTTATLQLRKPEQAPAPEPTVPVANEPNPAPDHDPHPAPPPTRSVSEVEDEGEPIEQPNTPKSATVQKELNSVPPVAAQFKKGSNYQQLVPTQPTSAAPGHVEVAEVFWYGCGVCATLDPRFETWRTHGKPPYVDFTRIPATWNDTLRLHARLFYTARLLGRLEDWHSQIFREIQSGNPLNTVEKIAAFCRAHGVSDADFHKTFSSAAIDAEVDRADILNRRYRIQSLPAIVVNGKYTTDVAMAGGTDQLLNLADELVASEHKR